MNSEIKGNFDTNIPTIRDCPTQLEEYQTTAYEGLGFFFSFSFES